MFGLGVLSKEPVVLGGDEREEKVLVIGDNVAEDDTRRNGLDNGTLRDD